MSESLAASEALAEAMVVRWRCMVASSRACLSVMCRRTKSLHTATASAGTTVVSHCTIYIYTVCRN